MNTTLEQVGKKHLAAVLAAVDVAMDADLAVEDTRQEIRRVEAGKREAVAAAAADPAWRPGGGGVAVGTEEDLAVLEGRLAIQEASAESAWVNIRTPFWGFVHEMPGVLEPLDRRLRAAADRLQAAAQGDLSLDLTPDSSGGCSLPGDRLIGRGTLPLITRAIIFHEFDLMRGRISAPTWDDPSRTRRFFERVRPNFESFWRKVQLAESVAEQIEEATRALRIHLEGAVQDLERLRD